MRPKTAGLDLPEGVVRKHWTTKSGEQRVGYYLGTRDKRGVRKQISLGLSLKEAMTNYRKRLAEDAFLIERHKNRKKPLDWQKELRRLHSNTKARAKFKNIYFDLTIEQVVAMFDANKRRCLLSGIPFNDTKDGDKAVRPWMPSLDRIDCDGSYTLDNVRMVCALVNIAMNQFGEMNLLYAARRIAGNLGDNKAP